MYVRIRSPTKVERAILVKGRTGEGFDSQLAKVDDMLYVYCNVSSIGRIYIIKLNI
jgi:hypothetical protein